MKKYLSIVKKELLFQFIFEILAILAIARIPYMEKLLVDNFIEKSSNSILEIIILVILFILIYSICSWISARFMIIRINKMRDSIQKDLFSSLTHITKQKFAEKNIGEYITMQNKDIAIIVGDYFQPLIDLIRNILEITIYAATIAIYIDWKISILLISSSMIICIVPKFFESKLSHKRSNQILNQGKYATLVQDHLNGITLIDSITRKNITYLHHKSSKTMNNSIYNFEFFKSISQLACNFAIKLLDMIVFIIIGISLIKNIITAGTALAIFSYTHCLMSPFKNFLYDINAIQSSKAIKNRFIKNLNIQNNKKIIKKSFNKSINFSSTNICYSDFSINNFNFSFNAKNKYIITGHSGCGKSTLLRLLANEITPDEGNVFIDNQNINELNTDNVLCFLHQNEHIYKANFQDNVTMFGSYSNDKYLDAIKLLESNILNKIKNTADCSSLSGGEKQIVAFMRALTSNKDIILLDEPFSALDQRNKSHMMTIVKNLKDKTIIMVSHDMNIKSSELCITPL